MAEYNKNAETPAADEFLSKENFITKTNNAQYDYANLPQLLTQKSNFVVYKIEPDKDGRPTKRPYNVYSDNMAKSNDPKTWATFNEAVEAYKHKGYAGIGYMFDGDGIWGIDIDHCIDDKGELSSLAKELLQRCNSYAELSPSRSGVHIFLSDIKAKDRAKEIIGTLTGKKFKNGVEIYYVRRFFTLTGLHIENTPTTINQVEIIAELFERFGAKKKSTVVHHVQRTSNSSHKMSDGELICKIMKSKQADLFSKLFYNGDISDYANDESRADLALMSILAFWTGKDPAQMESIFSQSALARREKWQQRKDYRDMTIYKAIFSTTDTYEEKHNTAKETKENNSDSIEDKDNEIKENVINEAATNCPLPYDKIKMPNSLKLDFEQHITRGISKVALPETKFNSIMLITKKFKNLDDNIEKVEIAVLKPHMKKWKKFTTERRNIASRTRIVDLASFGLDVTSTRAAQVVNYLDSFEVLNSDIINDIYTVSKTGWRNGNEFVYPNTNGGDYELDDSIKKQLDKIFTTNGDKSKVIDLLKKHINKDVVFAVIGAALAAPLVKIFRCPNIAAHVYANTGSGKSTLNKLALSIFADPNATGALPTADATRAGLEYYFAGRHDLPAIIEDIDGVNDDKSRKVIATLPYQFVNNTGRLRAKKTGGNDVLLDFSGSLITNGEKPLTTDTSSGGGKRRLIELKGEDKIFSDEEAREIYSIIEDNYGLFGREWIEYIKTHKDELKKNFKDLTQGGNGLFKEFVGKIPLHISNMAAIMTASVNFYIHFLGIDEDEAFDIAMSATRRILKSLPNEIEIADYEVAKSYISDWIDSHPKNFIQSSQYKEGEEYPAAAYETYGVIREEYVAIYPSTFREMLKGYGFSAEMITKQLADKEYITRGEGDNIPKKIKINGKSKRMIVICKDKL